MFRRRRGFVRGDIWYIYVNGGDNCQIISFDLINSIFKCWFWFKICCFKAVTGTNRIKSLFKGCDSWCIRGSGGNNFQMIIFDLINSLFKCWFRFKCFCFKAVVNNKRIDFSSKDVIADRFMAMEVILFKLLNLISWMVFSNVGYGSNVSSSNLLLILSWSKFLSKDVVILVISNFDGILTGI